MSSTIINCYENLPRKYKQNNYFNPNKLMPQHPFRLCIIGASNSGKTNTLMNIIELSKNFHKIYLYAKKLDESLYQYLIDSWERRSEKLGMDLIQYSNNIEDLITVDDVDESVQNLIILDDFCVEKNLDKVSEFFIRSRKSNCSIIFISQSYFAIPSQVRINSDYFIFTRNLKGNELIQVAKDQSGMLSIDEFKRLYRSATKDGYDFFMIDLKHKDDKYRFRKNFDFSLISNSKI